MADLDTANRRQADGDPERRGRRAALLGEHVKLLTALVSLGTAIVGLIVGFQGGRAVERNETNEASSALEASIEQLETDVSVLTDERDTLQRQLDEEGGGRQSSTTTSIAPPSDFLADMEPVTDTGWGRSRDLNLDGTLYANGLTSDGMGYCGSNGPVYERAVEYSIGRTFESFETVAGLSEDSPPGFPVKLEIFADEQLLATHVLSVGQPAEVDLGVTNVLRLKLVATNQFDDSGGCNYVYVALGDPVLR
jgi:hypothetical protein